MGKFKDLTGQKYGRLTVKERAENRNGRVCWLCRCECGNTCVVSGLNLTSGDTKSCGCLRPKHGLRYDPLYKKWLSIKQRCFNPKNKNYKDYGARGITIYPAWINDFKAFYDYVSTLEHFNEEGYTLDRKDNDGNYEPGNVRWATKSEQARNTRSNCLVEYEGAKMTLPEAAERSGINYNTLRDRCHAGDRGERLFRPVKK